MINIICGTILRLKGKIGEDTCIFIFMFGIIEFLIESAIIADYIL